jgi:hypothetical protein
MSSAISPLTKLIAVCAVVVYICGGCAYFVSWNDMSKSWLGQPISKFIKLNGEPTSVTVVGNGDSEYRFDLKKLDPSCIHWWLVNKEGVIVGHRHDGYCRPIG